MQSRPAYLLFKQFNHAPHSFIEWMQKKNDLAGFFPFIIPFNESKRVKSNAVRAEAF